MLGGDGSGKEERCGLRKAVRIFCGQIAAGTALRELGLVLGMAAEIIREALGFQITLRNDLNIAGCKALAVILDPLGDFRQQQRIVGATEDKSVDLRIFLQNLPQIEVHKIVCAGVQVLAVLNERNPKRTGLLGNRETSPSPSH